MRQVGSRQFQQNYHKEILHLPFQVTKKGKHLFYVVTSQKDFKNVVTSKIEEVPVIKVDKVVYGVPKIDNKHLLHQKAGEFNMENYL